MFDFSEALGCWWVFSWCFLLYFYFLTEVPLCFTTQASAKCQQCERLWMLMSTVFVPSLPLETCWLGLQPQVPLDPQSWSGCQLPSMPCSSNYRLWDLLCHWLRVRRALQQYKSGLCGRQPGLCVATLKSRRRPAWFSPAEQTHHRPHRRLSHHSPAFIYCLDLKTDVKKTQNWAHLRFVSGC